MRSRAFANIKSALRVGRAFHVDTNEIPLSSGATDDFGKKVFAERLIDIQSELGKLERHVARKFFRGDAVKHISIRCGGGARFRFAGDALSQAIERSKASGVIESADGSHGVVKVLSRDKTADDTPAEFVVNNEAGDARALREREESRTKHQDRKKNKGIRLCLQSDCVVIMKSKRRATVQEGCDSG